MLIYPVFQKRNFLKKSLYPTGGSSGQEYELYHVRKLHIAFTFARWVYDLPGEFCRFLRSDIWAETFFKFLCKKKRFAGSKRACRCHFGGKGENHLIPQQKGGEKMETIPRNYGGSVKNYHAFYWLKLRFTLIFWRFANKKSIDLPFRV